MAATFWIVGRVEPFWFSGTRGLSLANLKGPLLDHRFFMIAYADGQDRFLSCYVDCEKVGMNLSGGILFTDHNIPDLASKEIEVCDQCAGPWICDLFGGLSHSRSAG